MAKKIVQDLVTNKRSIRDISVPSRLTTGDIKKSSTKTARQAVGKKETKEDVDDVPVRHHTSDYNFDYDIDRPRSDKKWGIWSLVGVFVLAVIYGVVSLFASAQVTIVPKAQTVPLNGTFSALKDQPAGQFGYQIVSVSTSVQKDVVAGASQTVNTKATGQVVIYNTGTTVQNLVANTRVESSSGMMFRLVKAVSVPKATVQNKQTVPGSATASVVADQAGDTYNLAPTDFTLPGLKSTPQFKSVYGRSKVAMSGGFSGVSKKVDDTTLSSVTTELQQSLSTALQGQIAGQIPQNFILYPSSVSYTFAPVSQKPNTTEGYTTVVETGTASAIIFDRALLSQAVVASLASSLSGQGQAEVQDLDSLTFVLKTPSQITKDYAGQISFVLSGDSHVVWLVDTASLKSDLLGLKKSNLNALLQAKYPTISTVNAKIFPVWKQSFPTNPNDITVSQSK